MAGGSERELTTASLARTRGDPAVAAAALALWLLLGLFVVYPLAMLIARTLTDHGAFTTTGSSLR